MKFGLTGTVSVGKTTLVNTLSKLDIFKDYNIATERSKYLAGLGIPLNSSSTLLGQYVFLAERATELMQENILTDRTIYDVMAFTLSSDLISDEEKGAFINASLPMIKYYDCIFYVSPEGVPIEDNGIRSTNADYRNHINDTILNLLQLYRPDNLVILRGSLEERVNVVLDTFSKYL